VKDVSDAVTWRMAHEQLQKLATRRAALDAEEAKWLVIAQRERVHEELGLGSFREYVERVLGYAPHTAIERIRVAEELTALPKLRAALAAGDCSYSALREVTRVATAETEAQWLTAIVGKTAREIEPMVRGRQKGDAPDAPRDPDLQPRVMRFEVPPDVFAMFREARKAFEDELGERMDDNAVFAELCRRGLRGGDKTAPTHQIALMACPECGAGSQDAAGRVVDIAPEIMEHAQCDAQRVGRVDAQVPEMMTTDIPEPTRRAVERRDRNRCTVPGCGATRHLEIHHIIHIEYGGGLTGDIDLGTIDVDTEGAPLDLVPLTITGAEPGATFTSSVDWFATNDLAILDGDATAHIPPASLVDPLDELGLRVDADTAAGFQGASVTYTGTETTFDMLPMPTGVVFAARDPPGASWGAVPLYTSIEYARLRASDFSTVEVTGTFSWVSHNGATHLAADLTGAEPFGFDPSWIIDTGAEFLEVIDDEGTIRYTSAVTHDF
jgi:hypothetical protein